MKSKTNFPLAHHLGIASINNFLTGNYGTPLQCSCLENPMDGGAWWAAVHGVAKSRTRLSKFTFTFHFPLSCIGEGNGNPLQCSCLENPRHGGAWWAAVYGVAESQIQLKRLSRTGNYIQYTVITYNGNESVKEYIGLTESLCCYLKLTHCI